MSHLFVCSLMTVIYQEMLDRNDTSKLQMDIIAVYQWCNAWSTSLDANKCKAMRVSRQLHDHSDYLLSNAPSEPLSSYKYLGVHITSN